MLKYCVILTLSVNYSFSQVAESNQILKKETAEIIYTEIAQEAENSPSPEEQGFKVVISENRIIYRKEVNGIIVEFIPEEK